MRSSFQLTFRQKANSIAVSLGQHIESLQKTISILKEERDKELSIETQKQFDFLSELVYVENTIINKTVKKKIDYCERIWNK
jgi:hypothetical protein